MEAGSCFDLVLHIAKVFVDATVGAAGHACALIEAHPVSVLFSRASPHAGLISVPRRKVEPVENNLSRICM